jgi:hypothetical protein
MDDDIMPKSKATIEAEKRKTQVKRKTPDDAGAGEVKKEVVTTNAGDDSPVRVVPTGQDVDTLVAEDVEHHDTTTTDVERQAREYDLYIEKLTRFHENETVL